MNEADLTCVLWVCLWSPGMYGLVTGLIRCKGRGVRVWCCQVFVCVETLQHQLHLIWLLD